MDRRLDPATPSNPRGANRFRTRSLHVAAWGLAASAVPQNAAAAIISDIAVNQSPNSSFSFNGTTPEGDLDLVSMTGGMGFDLKLEAPGGMNPSTVELAISPSGGDDWLSLLGLGDTVDGSLTFGGSGFLVRHDTDSPVWAAGTTGYAGFTFNPDGIVIPSMLSLTNCSDPGKFPTMYSTNSSWRLWEPTTHPVMAVRASISGKRERTV